MRKILSALIALSLLLVPVFAEPQQNQPEATGSQGSQQQGVNAQKCADVTKKAGLVTDKYNQNKERYINAFQNIYQNMYALMTKLQASGLDTAKLEGDLNQYNNMIQNANRYYNEFTNGIDNAKNSVCGNNDKDQVQEMNHARQQLMNCKNEMLKLRTFAQETLKADLEALRAQIAQ